MRHVVHRLSATRIGVVYFIPGTQVASIVCDGLVESAVDMERIAATLSVESSPYVPPEERPIVKGFYGAPQGDLF